MVKAVQAVELALVIALDMDDDIAVIQQHPAIFAVTFTALRFKALLGHLIFDFIHNGAHLALVICRSQHEDLSNCEDIGDINSRDIGG